MENERMCDLMRVMESQRHLLYEATRKQEQTRMVKKLTCREREVKLECRQLLTKQENERHRDEAS